MSNRKTCITIDKKFSAIMAIIEKKKQESKFAQNLTSSYLQFAAG